MLLLRAGDPRPEVEERRRTAAGSGGLYFGREHAGCGMNWLVTGGCGFLGTALVRSLVEEGGHSVRVVDNLAVGERDHLAANTGVMPSIENPRADCMSNVVGTLNYLEAARHNGARRFVFASSGGTTIGEVEPPIHEEMVPHPVSPYGASKLAGEGYCSAYYGTFGIDTVALRFGNVYGPLSGHKNSVVARFIKRASGAEVLEIYGDGTQTRDFIYVGDLIRAVRLAATVEGVGGEIFQIATSAETTVQELVDRLLPVLAALDIKDVGVRNTEARRGEVRRNYADTTKAERMLGWRAEVELEEGLRRTVEWFMGS